MRLEDFTPLARKRHTAQQLLHGKVSVARPAEANRERQPTETEIYEPCL